MTVFSTSGEVIISALQHLILKKNFRSSDAFANCFLAKRLLLHVLPGETSILEKLHIFINAPPRQKLFICSVNICKSFADGFASNT